MPVDVNVGRIEVARTTDLSSGPIVVVPMGITRDVVDVDRNAHFGGISEAPILG